jgi:hypothetical protein
VGFSNKHQPFPQNAIRQIPAIQRPAICYNTFCGSTPADHAGVPSSRFVGAEPLPMQIPDDWGLTRPIGIGAATHRTVLADTDRAQLQVPNCAADLTRRSGFGVAARAGDSECCGRYAHFVRRVPQKPLHDHTFRRRLAGTIRAATTLPPLGRSGGLSDSYHRRHCPQHRQRTQMLSASSRAFSSYGA